MTDALALVLGSAAVGALISGIVNGIFNWKMKGKELERQDMEIALKLTELKHEQLLAAHDMYKKQGQDVGVDFFDPSSVSSSITTASRSTGRRADGQKAMRDTQRQTNRRRSERHRRPPLAPLAPHQRVLRVVLRERWSAEA
jgi:hypothetical protein